MDTRVQPKPTIAESDTPVEEPDLPDGYQVNEEDGMVSEISGGYQDAPQYSDFEGDLNLRI